MAYSRTVIIASLRRCAAGPRPRCEERTANLPDAEIGMSLQGTSTFFFGRRITIQGFLPKSTPVVTRC